MNRHDIREVAIYRDAEIVGRVPYNRAPKMSAFFIRENKAFADIKGAKSTGEQAMVWKSHNYVYRLYGPNIYVD